MLFPGKAFLKSDTAVALRRSVSIIPCIIVVSFINVYYEYFCKLMWLSAKSPDVLELLNIMCQCKLRFLDINMNFIEQNIDRKSTRLNSSHGIGSRMPSSA